MSAGGAEVAPTALWFEGRTFMVGLPRGRVGGGICCEARRDLVVDMPMAVGAAFARGKARVLEFANVD